MSRKAETGGKIIDLMVALKESLRDKARARGHVIVSDTGRIVALTAALNDGEAPMTLAHFDEINPEGAPHRVAKVVEE